MQIALPGALSLRGWWGDPWGVESPLRHHPNSQRDFGLPPESFFYGKRGEWLIFGSEFFFVSMRVCPPAVAPLIVLNGRNYALDCCLNCGLIPDRV